MTKDKMILKLSKFAEEHGIVLQMKGECGFGRPCVGFLKHDNYVDYCPTEHPNYSRIAKFYDDRLLQVPEDAYHKHDCMAVLVHDDNYDEGLKQLCEWVDTYEDLGVELVEYKTGARGIQAMISGVTGYAFKIKENES